MGHESRQRKAPKRIEGFVAHDVAPSGNDSIDLKTELKCEYVCAIDSIVSSMKERFDQNDIKIVKDINRMLISCANNEVYVTTEYVLKQLGVAAKFVQVDLLMEELKDLHVHINLYNMELKLESAPVIKKVTAISTIQDVLNTKPVSKASLPETHKLLILMSTYAMSSATAERTFSVMRRTKTWLTQDEIHTFSHIYALCKCMKVTYKCDMRGLKLLKGDPYFIYIYPRLKGVFNHEISLFIFPGKFKYL